MNSLLLIRFGFLVVLVCSVQVIHARAELRDPTRPVDYQASSAMPVIVEQVTENKKVSWRVSAIKISNKDKTAIVNGKLVRVGDTVNTGEIIEINPLSVVLNHEEQTLIVRLFNSGIKKEVAN